MKLFFTICIAFLITGQYSFSQESAEYLTREISITGKDSIIQANILNKKTSPELKNDCEYYWYLSGQINKNKGGYAGYLLHGYFRVFAPDKRLLSSGYFEEGLKSGEWKNWDAKGALLSVINWKKGIREGKSIFFDPNGMVKKELLYKEGKFHGECFWFENGEKVVKSYKDGEETVAVDSKKDKIVDNKKEAKQKPEKKQKETNPADQDSKTTAPKNKGQKPEKVKKQKPLPKSGDKPFEKEDIIE